MAQTANHYGHCSDARSRRCGGRRRAGARSAGERLASRLRGHGAAAFDAARRAASEARTEDALVPPARRSGLDSGRRSRFGTTAVIGLESMRDLAGLRAAYGFERVRAIPALRAAEVTVAREEVRALLARAATDGRIRYLAPVGPPRRSTTTPSDPLVRTIDPSTGQPFEWQFAAGGVDRALDVSGSDPAIVVGVIDSGAADVPDLAGKVDSRWSFAPGRALTDAVRGVRPPRRRAGAGGARRGFPFAERQRRPRVGFGASASTATAPNVRGVLVVPRAVVCPPDEACDRPPPRERSCSRASAGSSAAPASAHTGASRCASPPGATPSGWSRRRFPAACRR